MEWDLNAAIRGLWTIEDVEETSLWWKLHMGWFHFTLMWDVWSRNRERELTR